MAINSIGTFAVFSPRQGVERIAHNPGISSHNAAVQARVRFLTEKRWTVTEGEPLFCRISSKCSAPADGIAHPLADSHVCQVCATVVISETENQRVTSGLRMRKASQVTVPVDMLHWPL